MTKSGLYPCSSVWPVQRRKATDDRAVAARPDEPALRASPRCCGRRRHPPRQTRSAPAVEGHAPSVDTHPQELTACRCHTQAQRLRLGRSGVIGLPGSRGRGQSGRGYRPRSRAWRRRVDRRATPRRPACPRRSPSSHGPTRSSTPWVMIPRSRYVERFWLPTLGPTALLLLRHLATKFDEHPRGIELPVADTSRALGLGERDGRAARRSSDRSRGSRPSSSRAATASTTVAVRRNLPPVQRRHLRRLPAPVQAEHAAWARRASRNHRWPMRDAGLAASRSLCSSRVTRRPRGARARRDRISPRGLLETRRGGRGRSRAPCRRHDRGR